MQAYVFDTYVQTPEGAKMHFDVLIPDDNPSAARKAALQWLRSLNIPAAELSIHRCQLCHSETTTPEIQQEVQKNGHFILQMEGCPAPIF